MFKSDFMSYQYNLNNTRPQQPRKRGIGIYVIGVIIVLYFLGKFNSTPSPSTPAATAYGASAAEFNAFASDMKADYTDNEIRADSKYKHHIISVTGIVVSIGNDILDHPYVVLAKDVNQFTGVQCVFENKSEVASLNKGQSLTVTGECVGKMMNVQMDKCHL